MFYIAYQDKESKMYEVVFIILLFLALFILNMSMF